MQIGHKVIEYVIVLAIIVIMILIIIGIFNGVSSLEQNTAEQRSGTYWALAELSIPEYSLSEGTLHVLLKNNMGETISFNNVIIGESENLSFVLLEAGETVEYFLKQTCEGRTYSLPVQVDYSSLTTNLNYTFEGEELLRGECQG